MKSFLELANDKPKLSKRDLDAINRTHNHDGKVLRKAGLLQDLAKSENFGMP